MKRISVIAPVYNEKDNVELFINKVEETLKDKFLSYEIILVDDGSTDGSTELIQKLAKNNSHLKNYHFTKNNGQTAALAAGFKFSTGDIVVTMDSDLQTSPDDIHTLLPYLDEYDMINGEKMIEKFWMRASIL